MIVDVLIPLALNEPFSYESDIDLKIGDFVVVPFGNKNFFGLVLNINISVKEGIILKKVKNKVNINPMKYELIEFIKWTSEYNLIPLGNVLKMIISPLNFIIKQNKIEKLYNLNESKIENLKFTEKQNLIINFLKQKNIATKNEIVDSCKVGDSVLKNLLRDKIIDEIVQEKRFIQKIGEFNLNTLSGEQQQAFDILKLQNNFQVTLLEGTTGSGKTEVYFHLIAKLLKETNKQALILLPEIALTSQLILRFKQQFNFEPAAWHSEITESKKSEFFKSVSNNDVRVIIGTRSALFLPFKELGLIIVDEEHDASYKQSDNGCYNGRDLAIVRAKINNVPVILSSATPSLETLINVDNKKYKKVYLPSRFGKAVLPDVKIVDMRKEKLKHDSYISKILREEIQKNLENKKQTMLFMNRRGYSPVVLCADCGAKLQCPNCSANLSYHKSNNRMICHHCEYFIEKPKLCPSCGSENLIEFGPGVEKIEGEIKSLFPDARTILMVSDTTDTNKKLEEIVNKILNNEIDIIIGTQLVAKGHHFPNLTLVGILDSDASLFGGDIRAGERTYQLLTQVSGRAGREDIKGTVYFQSYNPDNLILQSIKNGDKNTLLDFEKQNRELGGFPPFGKMATINISSLNEISAYKMAKKITKLFPINKEIEIMGPTPALISKLAKMYRFNIIVKTSKMVNIQKLLRKCVLSEKYNSNVRIKIEIE